jgi:pyrroline-5-carboxylate reductase
MQHPRKSIFFIGVGNMGGAILQTLTESGWPAASVFFYEKSEETANKIVEKSKAKKVSSLCEGFSKADVVLLCIKPQVFSKISTALNAELESSGKNPVIVSIMAGVSLAVLRNTFPKTNNVVRTMPNIALTAKKGTVAIATDGIEEDVLQIIEFLFSKCADTIRVQESQMDAITGLSGSGPAFVFQFIEALAMGGVKMGLPRDTAMQLALSTVQGSAQMLKDSKLSPGELTANVCSPAGTTIAGLQELENKAFRGTIMAAVEAAAKRSAELGKALAFIFAFFISMPYAAEPSLGHLAMCSGVKQCLNYDYQQCSAEEKKPNPNIKYNAEFCAPYIELKHRGLQPSNPGAPDIYRYLGRQYRVTYELHGKLPISKETMIYLFENMDFTAQLVNAYRKTKYTIKYDSPNRKNFSGDNGDNLFGSFVWLLNDSAGVNSGMQHVFFGKGRTKILAWKLHGTATAILDLREIGKDSVAYEFRSIVSPSGSVLNSIMNLAIFNNMVKGKIQEIVDNIENAAKEFAKGNRKQISNYAEFKKTKWQKNLIEFEAITSKK